MLYVHPGRCPGFPGVFASLRRSVTHRIMNRGQKVKTHHDLVDEGWDEHALKVLSSMTEGCVYTRWVKMTVLTGTGDPRSFSLRFPHPSAG